jgi:hypothetical protein
LTALRHRAVGTREALRQSSIISKKHVQYISLHEPNQRRDKLIHSIQYSKTPRCQIASQNPHASQPLTNPVLHNHTPLRPAIILRPPNPLPLPTSTRQPARINNMTPLKRQGKRLRIRVRQNQRMRQRIQRQSRSVRPVRWPDGSRERRES